MIAENLQPRVRHAAALAAITAWLLMSACGATGNGATSSKVTAQMACASLSGKTIGGATLTTVVIKANGTAPTYCKVNGTIAPSLNFEIRLPDAWNGKLYYGGGGGYDGVIPELTCPRSLRVTQKSSAMPGTRMKEECPPPLHLTIPLPPSSSAASLYQRSCPPPLKS